LRAFDTKQLQALARVLPACGRTPAYYLPIMIFEITLGVWLLVKGIRAPILEQRRY
jgi:hypothetical protein